MYRLRDEKSRGSLPAALAQRYRECDGPSLRVALWLLCEGSGEAELIARELAPMTLETVERALALWEQAGLITRQDADGAPAERAPERAAKPVAPMSDARAAELTLRDPNVAALLQETQSLAGRTLSAAESRALLELYDESCMSVEALLTAVAFCLPRLKNRRSFAGFVRRTAEDWLAAGVCDARSAADYVKLLETRERREREVASALQCGDGADFTAPQRAAIARWFEEYGYDASFAREAFERTGNGSVSYINAILKSWYKKGYRTLRETYAESLNAPASRRPLEREDGAGSLFEDAIAALNAKG